MTGNRVFTDEELTEMGCRTLDLILQAIDRGDLERAKKLSNRMYREFQSMHDLLRDWATALMSHIYENHGEEDLYRAMRRAVEAYLRPMADEYARADFRRRVQMLAAGLRGHLQPMKLEEDDEKVSLKMCPCGSGERLFKDGGYGPPRNFTMIQKPHLLTFGMTDFPIYCCHAPLQELLPIEWLGQPIFVTCPAEKMAHESCQYHVYKDAADIPEEVYKRVGKKKRNKDKRKR